MTHQFHKTIYDRNSSVWLMGGLQGMCKMVYLCLHFNNYKTNFGRDMPVLLSIYYYFFSFLSFFSFHCHVSAKANYMLSTHWLSYIIIYNGKFSPLEVWHRIKMVRKHHANYRLIICNLNLHLLPLSKGIYIF